MKASCYGAVKSSVKRAAALVTAPLLAPAAFSSAPCTEIVLNSSLRL
ncbi:MAG TPA: hypothetical protein VNY29_10270 [Terriglobales bacterium]|nr:hypothetical protein [Terriglobales bacterium]